MSLFWRNVLQACWINPAACCLKRTHISIKIDNSIRKVTFSFILKNHDYYTTSWNDGRENRNLGEKKVKLERCITQLLFPKQNKKAKCRLKIKINEWINKIIVSSGTFSLLLLLLKIMITIMVITMMMMMMMMMMMTMMIIIIDISHH